MAAVASKGRVKKAARPRERFDGENGAHWYAIPSKGMLFSLAIAAFNGADFPGAEVLRSRALAKEILTQAREDGFIDEPSK